MTPRPSSNIRRHLLMRTAIGAVLAVAGVDLARAQVSGAVVAGGGSAAITASGATTNVRLNQPRTIIDWNSFNVAQGQTVNFNFNSGTDIVLNRTPGTLTVNGAVNGLVGGRTGGNVWLYGGSGVIFGPNAQVNVGGLMAMTAPLRSDADFLGGKSSLSFQGGAADASILVKAGARLHADGALALIAPSVATEAGSTVTAGGTATYAAADNYTIRFSPSVRGGFDLFDFEVPASALQDGTISATPLAIAGSTTGANVVMASVSRASLARAVISLGGQTTAQSATLGADGTVVLSATGAPTDVTVTGAIRADRSVTMAAAGGDITLGGNVLARAQNGQGGSIRLGDGGTYTVTQTTGTVLDAASTGAGQTGGSVVLTANAVGSDGRIDVSAPAGGGAIALGGGFHGADPTIADADYTLVGPNAVLNASATQAGSGGGVVVWSNVATAYSGQLISRGLGAGGNGGAAEVSSHGNLAFQGSSDLGAAGGVKGTLLLDPSEIDIQTSGANVVSNNFQGTTTQTLRTSGGQAAPDPSVIAPSLIYSLLDGSNVNLVSTGNPGTIKINEALVWNGGASTTANSGLLTLNAANGITFGAGVATPFSVAAGAGKFNVSLISGNTGVSDAGAGLSISLNGGSLTMNGAGAVSWSGPISAGAVSLTGASVSLTGGLTASSLTASASSGDVDTRPTTAATNSIGSFGALSGANIWIANWAPIQLTGDVTASTQLSLSASAGITQTAGTISTPSLTANAQGGALSLTSLASGSSSPVTLNAINATTTVEVDAQSALALNGNIGAPTSVTLSAQGAITQNAGVITSASLAATALKSGTYFDISLADENLVGTAAANPSGVVLTGDGLTYHSGQPLVVDMGGAMIGAGPAAHRAFGFSATGGLTVIGSLAPTHSGSPGAVSLQAPSGVLDLTALTSITSGDLTLSGASITTGVPPTISASGVYGVTADSQAGLSSALFTPAANPASWNITVNSGGFTLPANLTASGAVNISAPGGAVSTGGFAISGVGASLSGQSIAIDADVSAGSGTLALTAGAGAVNQTGGLITAGTLQGSATTGFTLLPGNAIASIGSSGVSTTGGGVTVLSNEALAVNGQVSAGAGIDIETSSGNLTIGANVGAPAASGGHGAGNTVVLKATSGQLTQNAGSTIAGYAVDLQSSGTMNISGIVRAEAQDSPLSRSASNTIALTTTGGSANIRLNSGGEVHAGVLDVNAGGQAHLSNGTVDVDVVNATVNGDSDFSLNKNATYGSLTDPSGTLTFTANNHNLTFTGNVNATAVTVDNAATLSGIGVTATAGAVSLTGQTVSFTGGVSATNGVTVVGNAASNAPAIVALSSVAGGVGAVSITTPNATGGVAIMTGLISTSSTITVNGDSSPTQGGSVAIAGNAIGATSVSLSGVGVTSNGVIYGTDITADAGSGTLSLLPGVATTGGGTGNVTLSGGLVATGVVDVGGSYTLTGSSFGGGALAPVFTGATGDYSLTATADLIAPGLTLSAPVGNLTVNAGSHNLSLFAANAPVGQASLSGGSVQLAGASSASSGYQVNATGAGGVTVTSISTASGPLSLTSSGGGLTSGALSSGTGDVFVSAQGPVAINGAVSGGTAQTPSVSLTSTGSSQSVTGSVTGANVNLSAGTALSVGGVLAANSAILGAGTGISVPHAQVSTVSLTNSGSGDISFDQSGSAIGLTVSALSTGGGAVSIKSGGDLALSALGGSPTDVTFLAGGQLSGLTNLAGTGAITLSAGLSSPNQGLTVGTLSTTGGAITLSASGAITASSLQASGFDVSAVSSSSTALVSIGDITGGNITVSGAGLVIGSPLGVSPAGQLNGSGTVSLTATNGGVTVNVYGDTTITNLSAGTGAMVQSTNSATLRSATLGATGTLTLVAGGDAVLGADAGTSAASTNAVTGGAPTAIAEVQGGGNAVVNLAGPANIATATAQTGDLAVTATGVTLANGSAGRTMTVEATAGDASVTNASGTSVSVAASGNAYLRNLTITAPLPPAQGDGPLAQPLPLPSWAAPQGAFSLIATGGVASLGRLAGESATTSAGVVAGSGGVVSGRSVLADVTGGLSLVSVTATGGGAAINATGALNVGQASAVGPLTITSGGDASVGQASATGALAITSGLGNVSNTGGVSGDGVSVQALAGSASLLGPVVSTGTLDVKARSVTVGTAGTTTSAGGATTLTSTGGDVTLAGTFNGAALTLAASGGVNISGAATTTGALTVTANAGGISVNQASSAGAMTLAANAGNVTVGKASATGALAITSGLGNVSNTGGVSAGGVSVQALAGSASLLGPVVSTGTLDVKARSVTVGTAGATSSVSGATTLTSTAGDLTLGGTFNGAALTLAATGGGVTVAGATTATGAGSLTATGGITIQSLTADTLLLRGSDLSLTQQLRATHACGATCTSATLTIENTRGGLDLGDGVSGAGAMNISAAALSAMKADMVSLYAGDTTNAAIRGNLVVGNLTLDGSKIGTLNLLVGPNNTATLSGTVSPGAGGGGNLVVGAADPSAGWTPKSVIVSGGLGVGQAHAAPSVQQPLKSVAINSLGDIIIGDAKFIDAIGAAIAGNAQSTINITRNTPVGVQVLPPDVDRTFITTDALALRANGVIVSQNSGRTGDPQGILITNTDRKPTTLTLGRVGSPPAAGLTPSLIDLSLSYYNQNGVLLTNAQAANGGGVSLTGLSLTDAYKINGCSIGAGGNCTPPPNTVVDVSIGKLVEGVKLATEAPPQTYDPTITGAGNEEIWRSAAGASR